MAVWRLYYDSQCGLCDSSQLRAVRWARRAGQPLEPVPLDSPEADAKGYGDEMVLEADKVLVGADAWLRLLRIAPWPLRALAGLDRWSATRRLVGAVYVWVARRRSRRSGPASCPR